MVKLRTGATYIRSSAQWVWLVLVGQGSRADFRWVKHEKLLGQDFDPGRGWKYSRLICSVTCSAHMYNRACFISYL